MLDSLLNQLAQDPAADIDVAEVALLLATDEYPELFVPDYMERLDALADQVRPFQFGNLTESVEALSEVLFEDEAFSGNAVEYYDPRNSYLNEVLDRKLGLPITLSVLAMAVGNRAGMNIVGVGLPAHFIAKAIDDDEELLFDPFHGGQVLTVQECELLVQSKTGRPYSITSWELQATPAGHIVMRMLNNLRGIYNQTEDFARMARVLGRLRQLTPGDMTLHRDLGVALIRDGKAGAAIDHLRAYVDAMPDAPDVAEVRKLASRAVSEVSRWN